MFIIFTKNLHKITQLIFLIQFKNYDKNKPERNKKDSCNSKA